MLVTQDYKNVTLTRDERRLIRAALYALEGGLRAGRVEHDDGAAFWNRKLEEVELVLKKVAA